MPASTRFCRPLKESRERRVASTNVIYTRYEEQDSAIRVDAYSILDACKLDLILVREYDIAVIYMYLETRLLRAISLLRLQFTAYFTQIRCIQGPDS